jgi:hypothetical protein
VSVASGGGGAVGGGSGGAVGGDGGVSVGSWPAVGEVAGGEEDVILVGKRGDGARGWRGGGPLEKGRRPSGSWRRYTGRRGGALADDGGALVEATGHSWRTAGWSEGRRRSGTMAALGGKIWQLDGVVSFSHQT